MKFRAILPCAGYGKRLDMPLNASKELLTYDGRMLIGWHLNLCSYYNITPLVIVRKEKEDLIEYCKKRAIEYLVIEPKGEWQNTVLMSESHWEEKNILLLPDTRFSEEGKMKTALNMLKDHNAVIGVHRVVDGEKWGTVTTPRYNCIIKEKPIGVGGAIAWGFITFRKDVGKQLFTELRDTKETMIDNATTIKLNWFHDYTRNK